LTELIDFRITLPVNRWTIFCEFTCRSLFGYCHGVACDVTSVGQHSGLTRPPAVFWERIVFRVSRQGGMPPWVVCGAWMICDTVYSRLPLAGQQAHESAVRSLVRCAVGAVTWWRLCLLPTRALNAKYDYRLITG